MYAHTLQHLLLLSLLHNDDDEFEQRNFKNISVCFCISFCLCQFSVCARIFNNAKVFETQSIRCTTVAPETTNIRTEKREQKEDVTFFVYLFGKRPVSFSTIPKRAINITFLKSEESWLGLWVKHHQNPFTSFTCNFWFTIFLSSRFSSPHLNQKHFHLPTFFHLTISYKSKVDSNTRFHLHIYLSAHDWIDLHGDIIQIDKKHNLKNPQQIKSIQILQYPSYKYIEKTETLNFKSFLDFNTIKQIKIFNCSKIIKSKWSIQKLWVIPVIH